MKNRYHDARNGNARPLPLCILGRDERLRPRFRQFDPSILCEGIRHWVSHADGVRQYLL